MMIVTGNITELRDAIRAARDSGQRIGCVPTMGALHAGHVSLFHVSRSVSDFTAATIFVNPSQFGPNEDFHKYPRPLERDLDLARQANVDLVFTPDPPMMYPEGFCTSVAVDGLSSILEGAIRPTHFRGVTTVVLKLLNQVQPDIAIFGAKDYQQQAIIRRMVMDLDVPVEILTAPTMREADGLAMSSRNAYLSPEQRSASIALFECLMLAEDMLHAGERSVSAVTDAMRSHMQSKPPVTPDYAVIADPMTLKELTAPQSKMVALVAARLGTTRLIDNREINLSAG